MRDAVKTYVVRAAFREYVHQITAQIDSMQGVVLNDGTSGAEITDCDVGLDGLQHTCYTVNVQFLTFEITDVLFSMLFDSDLTRILLLTD